MEETAFKIQANTQPAITSVGDLRKALKAVKDEMVGLEEGSEQWLKLANKAGEYKHTLDELNQSIKGASSDFGDMVGNISAVGAGMVGAFQSAKAALSMFGVESEEVMKSIQTMQNLMAMTQGLASIDAGIKAFKKLTATVKASTTAMKLLNAVMTPKVLLPVVAAIAAISAAAAVLTKRIKAAREEAERAQKVERTVVEVSNNAAASYAKQSSELQALLKIAGDETQSIGTRQKACDLLNQKYKGLNASIDSQTSALKYNKQVVDDLIESYKQMAIGQAAMTMLVDKATESVKLQLKAEELQAKIEKERKNNSQLQGNIDVGATAMFGVEGGLYSVGQAQQSVSQQNNISSLNKQLEKTKQEIKNIGDEMTKITNTFGNEITKALGTDKSGTGVNGSMSTTVNLTQQYLTLLLEVTKGTKNYSTILSSVYALKKSEVEKDREAVETARKLHEENKSNVGYLKSYNKAQEKFIKDKSDELKLNSQLYESYLSLFNSMENVEDLNREWNRLKATFLGASEEELANISSEEAAYENLSRAIEVFLGVKTKVRANNSEPVPGGRTPDYGDDGTPEPKPNASEDDVVTIAQYKTEVQTFAEYLGLSDKQLQELYININKRRNELTTLELKANGELKTEMQETTRALETVEDEMLTLVSVYGEEVKTQEKYLQLQVRANELQEKQDELNKRLFNSEEKLAKIRRQANGEEADSLDAINNEILDVEEHMNKLILCFGDAIKSDEEYLQLQIRLLGLQQDKVDKITEEKLAKIELSQLDIEIAAAESYRIEGEVQSLNQLIDLEKERLAVIAERYGVESEQYKQQLLQLKNTKKELEAVKWASVDVANNGLGYIADMLGSIGDLYDTNTKEGFEKQKKFAIAQTIMNGIAGTISAVTSWMNPANAWMTAPVQAVMAALQSAAIGVATAAQVAAIKRTTFDGGGSSSSVGNLTLVPPVEYTSLVQGANIEENTSNTKQYVAVTEINEVADRVDVAEQESRY